MARSFVRASSQFLETDTAVVTGYPLTMACWFNSDDATVNQELIEIIDKDVSDQRHRLMAGGALAGDPIRYSAQAGAAQNADTTTGYSTNTWHHACAVGASATSRDVYIDGGSVGSNTTSVTPTNLDRTSIGRDGDSTPGNYMSGRIAEAAVWNVALTLAEITALSKGISPLFIRPASLVAYWPLIGRFSPEIDVRGRLELTVTGATAGDHVRMLTASRTDQLGVRGAIVRVATAIAAAFSVVVPARVMGTATRTPAPVTAAFSVVLPAVKLLWVRVATAIAASFSVVVPTRVMGTATRTATAIAAAFSVVVPTRVMGAMSRSATAVTAAFSVVLPTRVMGAMTRVATPVVATFAAVLPTRVMGAMSRTATAISAAFSVVLPQGFFKRAADRQDRWGPRLLIRMIWPD